MSEAPDAARKEEGTMEYQRLTWKDVFTVPDGKEPPSEADQAALNAYLRVFAVPRMSDHGVTLCVGCGAEMQGGLTGALLGGAPGKATWQWSIAHGECHCSRCGHPARAYHYDIGGTGDDAIIKRLNLTLQVHPDELVRRAAHA
jgi:hypothetical protein